MCPLGAMCHWLPVHLSGNVAASKPQRGCLFLHRTACQGLQSRGKEPRVGGDQYLGSVRAHPWAGAHIFSLGQTISVWYVGTQLIREKAACLRSLRAKGSNTFILDFFLSRCPPQLPKKSIPRRSLRPKNRPLTGPF